MDLKADAKYRISDLFRLCPPVGYASPVTARSITQKIIMLKIWHVRLGCANNMHPLSLGA